MGSTTTRGTLTLFKDIFEADQSTPETEEIKGRAQLQKRNECLVDRYYHKGKFTDKRYSKILEELSEEFFLSQITVAELLEDNFGMLQTLKAEQPQKSHFIKKWPHLVW